MLIFWEYQSPPCKYNSDGSFSANAFPSVEFLSAAPTMGRIWPSNSDWWADSGSLFINPSSSFLVRGKEKDRNEKRCEKVSNLSSFFLSLPDSEVFGSCLLTCSPFLSILKKERQKSHGKVLERKSVRIKENLHDPRACVKCGKCAILEGVVQEREAEEER